MRIQGSYHWLRQGMSSRRQNGRNAGYDANGNMTSRLEDGKAYLLTYDSENRLTTVSNLASGQTTTFTYDADGNRVKGVVGGVTTCYVGNYFEAGTAWAKYYYFGGKRIAMRTSAGVTYIHGDQLGSATNTTGASAATQRYYPWGTQRSTTQVATPYRFTGQREESTIGLYFYNARWYDPALGRFTQADTLVPSPGNPQSLNRYSYVLNSPVKYTDPSGHWLETLWDIANVLWDITELYRNPGNVWNWAALVLDVGAVAAPVPGGAGLAVRGGKATKAAVEVASHADEVVDAANVGAEAAAEVAEEAAERFGRKAAGETVERAIKGEIKPARELLAQSVPGTEVHHLIEQRFAGEFGVKPGDLPAIRLDKTFHQKEVTARLFSALPTYPKRPFSPKTSGTPT